jgi:hypothetical protein
MFPRPENIQVSERPILVIASIQQQNNKQQTANKQQLTTKLPKQNRQKTRQLMLCLNMQLKLWLVKGD